MQVGVMRNVSLNNRLSKKRLTLPPCDHILIIIWDTDEDGIRTVFDIVSGTPRKMIRYFNKWREEWSIAKRIVNLEGHIGPMP